MKLDKKKVKQILNNRKNWDNLLDGFDGYLVLFQFKEHYPDFETYIPYKVEEISVEQNKQGHWQFHFHGEWEGDAAKEWLSWKRLGQSADKAQKSRVVQAAREVIKRQRAHFVMQRGRPSSKWIEAKDKIWVCEECSTVLTIRTIQVDHIKPTFMELFQGFMAKHKFTWANIPIREIEDDDGSFANYIFFNAVALDWAEYHHKHAKLQILCMPCHMEKTLEDNQKILKESEVL